MNRGGSGKVFGDPRAELRTRFVKACRLHEKRCAEAEARGLLVGDRHWPRMDFTPFIDLRCGAKGKRTGRPCPLINIYANGRCRFHGGLSTGPKTAEGKARAALNGARVAHQGSN